MSVPKIQTVAISTSEHAMGGENGKTLHPLWHPSLYVLGTLTGIQIYISYILRFSSMTLLCKANEVGFLCEVGVDFVFPP